MSNVMGGGSVLGIDSFHAWWIGWCRGKSYHQPPWFFDGCVIYADGAHLIGHRRRPWEVWPTKTAIMPFYQWLPDSEPYPGWELWTMLKKPVPTDGDDQGVKPYSLAKEDEKHLSVLVEYMTQGTWDDGSPRELSRLSVWFDSPHFKVMLRDTATGKVLFVASPVLSASLAAMNAALKAPDADWRADKNLPGQPPKKKFGKG